MTQEDLLMHRRQVEGLAKAISRVYGHVIAAGGLNNLTYNFAVDHIALASQLGGYLAVLRLEEKMHPDLTKKLFSEEIARINLAPELERALKTIRRDATAIMHHLHGKSEAKTLLSQYQGLVEDLTAALEVGAKSKR